MVDFARKPTHPVAVSVLLTDWNGGVLLAKRKNNSGAGLLSTPGGRLELTETIEQCAAREFKEECGAELLDFSVIGWREHFRFGNHYIMFYVLAKSYGGTITNCIPDKSEDWAFIKRSDITPGTCTEPEDILDLAAGARNDVYWKDGQRWSAGIPLLEIAPYLEAVWLKQHAHQCAVCHLFAPLVDDIYVPTVCLHCNPRKAQ